MEFKGTKGEWFPVEYAGYINIQSGEYYSENDNILDCESFPREEVEANAKLIAAAPELLKQLKVAVFILKESGITKGQDQLEQAIKKATT